MVLGARQADGRVVITVANDGPPVTPDVAESIFAAGFRADDADRHDGVGLGLALARRLARAADGDVELDRSAEWTTFRLILPAG